MLKRIPVSQARVGMHLHKLDGAWLSHPFWRTRFTLTDPGDLGRLRDSGVAFLWIDVAQGVDVAEPEADAIAPASGQPGPAKPRSAAPSAGAGPGARAPT